MQLTQSSNESFWKRLIARFSSYTSVGVSTFLFDLALIWFFVIIFGITEPFAIGVAFLIAVHLNYTILRFWVYRKTPEKMPRTYTYFLTLAIGATFIIPTLVTWFEATLGLDMFLARVIVGGIIGLIGFAFNTFLNFRVV